MAYEPKAYVATRYWYDRSNLNQTHEVTGHVTLVGNTTNETYQHTYNGITISVRVVDFIVDAGDPREHVELWIYNYDPPFRPVGGVTKDSTSTSPYKFRFIIPASGAPDYKWGVNDPLPGVPMPTPPWPLRVTVKRK